MRLAAPFRSSSRSAGRAPQVLVDRARNLCRAPGVVDARNDPADLILAPRVERLVHVVPLKIDRRTVDGRAIGAVDAGDLELPVAGVDRAAQHDLVAHLPA